MADEGSMGNRRRRPTRVGKLDEVTKGSVEAAKYCKMRSDEWDVENKPWYAKSLLAGEGVAKDPVEAARYFTPVADSGSIDDEHEYAKALKDLKAILIYIQGCGWSGNRCCPANMRENVPKAAKQGSRTCSEIFQNCRRSGQCSGLPGDLRAPSHKWN
jgi:TPR repeat protein